ncbi:hypothetical protein MYSTI_06878 [Myxococcus stipitatus DSM 14675]|uniref:Uncharacterized protein n=1 Tax=Myxococcus stipitatus (strain DSM 14675 / JCM 12634 / Mx s8) TaxID=1278073 RepID=L7UGQ2_MYXSD|nr:hypothetical protein [Myxococcus stipitatus]AGC48151.1 hypothetical protein MYSTI_06878 [Myxococcus stipitatus DSM 14675]
MSFQALKSVERGEAETPDEPARQMRLARAPEAALPPMCMGRLVAREATGWRVRIGATEHVLSVDPSVDPALLEEALASGARVIVDAVEAPVIVGLLTTQRALQVDRQGRVDARVRGFSVVADEKVLLRVPGSFVQVTSTEVELYANRVLTRAREVAKVLATLIKLN